MIYSVRKGIFMGTVISWSYAVPVIVYEWTFLKSIYFFSIGRTLITLLTQFMIINRKPKVCLPIYVCRKYTLFFHMKGSLLAMQLTVMK